MKVKKLTKKLLESEDMKIINGFTGDTSHLKRRSVKFLYDFSKMGYFLVCDENVIVSKCSISCMERGRGYGYFAAFFYGAEKYDGVELKLYDVPCAEMFYILQKIPHTEDAVFTIKEIVGDNGDSEDATIVYQVIVNFSDLTCDYKKAAQNVFSDKELFTGKSVIIDKMRYNIRCRNKDCFWELDDMIKLMRTYDMFRRDPWISKKTLPKLQFKDFFNAVELQKMKEMLDWNDLKLFLKYYG